MPDDGPVNENTFQRGWFRREGDAYIPMPVAQSSWRADQLRGLALRACSPAA